MESDFSIDKQSLEKIEHNRDALLKYLERADKLIQAAVEQRNFSDLIKYSDLRGQAKRDLENLNNLLQEASAKESERLVATDYALDTPMVHTFDVDLFSSRIQELFLYYNTDKLEMKLAPYFPLIQSSGMGKTKLLVEYKQSAADKIVILLQCTKQIPRDRKLSDKFTDWFKVPEYCTEVDRNRICATLTSIVENARRTRQSERREKEKTESEGKQNKTKKNDGLQNDNFRVVILFDEAQHLLDNNEFAFRCVRWWLRRESTKNVVAVFSGTTCKLANSFPDPPETTTSRDAPILYRSGRGLYPPFYEIHSIGIFGNNGTVAGAASEYEKAIPYGRPVFAMMQNKNDLTTLKENIILTRMLLLKQTEQWDNNLPSCYSILGTRVQMGHVNFQIASDVTSRAYAGLIFFSSLENKDIANVCFFPDPVCARLAMGMMIKDCNLVNSSGAFLGQDPNFWTEKATEMFSYGICRPDKGGIGEVACALYLLFCGDKIRYATNQQLTQFSVPLDKLVSLLRNPHQEATLEAKEPVACVSCIQVCRNYLRHSLGQIMHLLPHWYRSGRGIYAYDSCCAYDIIIPVRYRKQRSLQKRSSDVLYDYCPLLVSFKNQQSILPKSEEAYKEDMVAALRNEGIKTGLCMLVVAGLANDGTVAPETTDIVFEEGCIKCCTVTIQSNDPFGISRFLEMTSMSGGEQSEIYASHSEALFTPRAIPTNGLLRARGSKRARDSLDQLRDQFEVGTEKPNKKRKEVTNSEKAEGSQKRSWKKS